MQMRRRASQAKRLVIRSVERLESFKTLLQQELAMLIAQRDSALREIDEVWINLCCCCPIFQLSSHFNINNKYGYHQQTFSN